MWYSDAIQSGWHTYNCIVAFLRDLSQNSFTCEYGQADGQLYHGVDNPNARGVHHGGQQVLVPSVQVYAWAGVVGVASGH